MPLSNAQTALATPTKASATPVTDSPGVWRHPRIEEITRRQEASTFTDKNLRHIVLNVALSVALYILRSFASSFLSKQRASLSYVTFHSSRP